MGQGVTGCIMSVSEIVSLDKEEKKDEKADVIWEVAESLVPWCPTTPGYAKSLGVLPAQPFL